MSISCPVCRANQYAPCLTLQTTNEKISYFKCTVCSLIFQDPTVFFKAEEIYNEDYILRRSQDTINPNITRAREQTAEHYFHWVEQFIPKGNLLEVGCATGVALKVAQNRGWKVFGVEINEKAAQMAKELIKTDVIQVGNLNDNMFPNEFFSLVTLFDVIEHIPQPVDFLKLLWKKIIPGGGILFVTPNINTLSFTILKEKWPHFVQEHLLLYSPQSMNQLLKETGFSAKEQGWAKKYISLEMLRRHSESHPHVFYKSIGALLSCMPALEKKVFPFNVGEMFVFAQKV